MHNDNFGERSECASPDSRKYAFVSEPAPAKPSTCQCPHLEGSCGARIWEFGEIRSPLQKNKDCGLSMRVIGCTSQPRWARRSSRHENLGKLHRECRKRKGSEISEQREMGVNLVKILDQSEIIGAAGSCIFHGRAGGGERGLGTELEEPEL